MTIFWILLAFGMGSIPFGLVISRLTKGVDPRQAGSGNTGATNVARLCGMGCGILVLVLDIAKGWLPVALALDPERGWLAISLVALAALLGHVYSPFLEYKGGKAVATTVGVFLALSPGVTVAAGLACLATIKFSGYVSLGSLTLAVCLPVFCLFAGLPQYVPLALAVMVLLFARHRENIERLARGQENPYRKGQS
jgi:glycerol-3-phosphate acyltransferase PlsY